MTEKFIGQFQLESNADNSFKNLVIVKHLEKLPPKEEWHKESIYEFNGKMYKPVTQKAIDNLDRLVKQLQTEFKFTKAVKDGKRKPSSIKYAIQTYGVEPFHFV